MLQSVAGHMAGLKARLMHRHAKPETPVSVEEGQKEKEVKDVLTAHIYSYLQKQKNVYESQVPKEAGPIDVARVKTDIRRAERE